MTRGRDKHWIEDFYHQRRGARLKSDDSALTVDCEVLVSAETRIIEVVEQQCTDSSMELTVSQRWLLLAPPIACLAAVVLLWMAIQLMFGNLTWLFPVGDGQIPPQNEPVMTPGMKIIAKTPACELTITAGRGRKRSYTWDGATRSVEMIPRPERWNGSFGLYFPGPGNHWFPHHGVTRCVADEGQINFSSVQKAMEWLSQTPAFQPRIYRNGSLELLPPSTGPYGDHSCDVPSYPAGIEPRYSAAPSRNSF